MQRVPSPSPTFYLYTFQPLIRGEFVMNNFPIYSTKTGLFVEPVSFPLSLITSRPGSLHFLCQQSELVLLHWTNGSNLEFQFAKRPAVFYSDSDRWIDRFRDKWLISFFLNNQWKDGSHFCAARTFQLDHLYQGMIWPVFFSQTE